MEFSKLNPFEKMQYRKENLTWTQLDVNFNGGFKMPENWGVNLQSSILEFWQYMEVKKGDSYATAPTLNSQIKMIEGFLNVHTQGEIITSIKECIKNSNVTFSPQWAKDKIKKENEINDRKPKSEQKSKYVRFAESIGVFEHSTAPSNGDTGSVQEF